MTKQDNAYNGLLLVDKPGVEPQAAGAPPNGRAPLTSHDVVQRVRRLSGQRRIGHTGTLDPMASGLLVLCLGWATRLVEFYQGHDKVYRAQIALGWATDTLDALGVVTERADVPLLDEQRIEQALASFRGPIMQRPPVYSALKQGGESLHYKARRGESVDVETRAVTFHRIALVEFEAPDRILLDIECSAGAYIRSLADDVGRALGTLATLTSLRRTRAGQFSVDQAHSLETLAAAAERGHLAGLLLPPGAGLEMPTVTVAPEDARRLGFGQTIPIQNSAGLANGDRLALCRDATGALVGILRCVASQKPADGPALWKAEKWFA